MTLGEFREQTKGMSDDLELEFYSERYNDSTQPKYLEFEPKGYIEFIIDDDRWDLVDKKNTIPISEGATNGDVIKAMFPNIDASVSGDGDVIDVYNLGIYCQTLDTEWWNAPYKAESEGRQG